MRPSLVISTQPLGTSVRALPAEYALLRRLEL
jgi:hypothetical protein